MELIYKKFNHQMRRNQESDSQNIHFQGGCCGSNLLFLKNMEFPQIDKKLQEELKNLLQNNDQGDAQDQVNDDIATTIITAKRIYTMDDQGTVQAMALNGKKIIWTGCKASIDKKVRKNKKTVYLNYPDKIIIPGFIDPHCHYFYLGMGSQYISMKYQDDLTPQKNYEMTWKRLEDQVKKVELQNKLKKDGQKKWVFANFYDKLHMYQKQITQTKSKLHISYLDSIGKNTPIFILQANTHIAHVNSKAFNQAKIDPFQYPPKGGSFGFDIDENTHQKIPNGMIIQPPAVALFGKKFPVPNLKQFMENITKLMKGALERGCTSIHDGGIGVMGNTPMQHMLIFYYFQKILPIFQKIRVSGFITYELWERNRLLFVKPRLRGDNIGANFRLTGIKFWYDGSVQGGSAYLQDGYNFKGAQFNGKTAAIKNSQLIQMTNKVVKSKWPVAVHSSGDASFHDVVAAIIDAEKYRSKSKTETNQNLRIHRIEHCTLAGKQDLEIISKISKQNYTIHPSFLINYISQYGKIYKQYLLSNNAAEKKMFLVGTCMKLGLNPSLHSDFIMQKIDPLAFIHDAVNRIISQQEGLIQVLNPSEKINIFDALKTVTINAAKACYCDDIVGSLKVGKFADFIVLDEKTDLLDQRNLKNIKVSQTWVNGVCVYQAPKKLERKIHSKQILVEPLQSKPSKKVKITRQRN